MNREKRYIHKRIWKAGFQSITFYLCRVFPIHKRKIVFCCIEGTTGYTCNPKYIAEELIRKNEEMKAVSEQYELVWLVNDITKKFPKEIKVVRNTLWNRAYHLSTAKFWIDNSRKQLEVRKRKGQIYIQTWHAKLGFKPTGLDRGASFSKIAYLVTKHDSDMVDYWLSNSDWYDNTLPTGSIYEGETLRTGSPRCDILVKAKNDAEYKEEIKRDLLVRFGSAFSENLKMEKIQRSEKEVNLSDIHFLMYAPTFRGGSQGTNREIAAGQGFPDYRRIITALEKRFGGTWIILLRLHPQLVARNLDMEIADGLTELHGKVISASRVEDMYEVLAGCDAFMTDYSSAAFDAAVMEIPIFLYAEDYKEYEGERGKLLWNLRKLPFPLAERNEELSLQIEQFDEMGYQQEVNRLFADTKMEEDGHAAERLVEWMNDTK
uniref:CDP-glycerol glycerophosphotransferase family protein n=1 Tax=Acetatifactor sp. TaxID=1872090 RepID=UPI004057C994